MLPDAPVVGVVLNPKGILGQRFESAAWQALSVDGVTPSELLQQLFLQLFDLAAHGMHPFERAAEPSGFVLDAIDFG